MIINDWNIEKMCGYKPLTTLYRDFSMTEHFDSLSLKEHIEDVFKEVKKNYKLLTEFIMVLNWKIFEHHNKNNILEEIYNDYWEKYDEYAQEHLKGKELDYFYETTD